MRSSTPDTTEDPSFAELRLEKASLNLGSVKIQMMLGLALALIACLTAYRSTLGVGFLLDDFLHVDNVARAVAGHWATFLANFTGNWAGSDLMKSYRPLVSLSFLVDYLLWHTNAVGYHLSNLILFFLTSVFVGLITLEITGLYGNRLGASAAIWASLLFILYPLHPESVIWIVGRVDLLCALLCLASLFAYLRFRRLQENAYLWLALLLFFLALTSKEMAVTLPAIILLSELCLHSDARKDPRTTTTKIKQVSCFFAILIGYALFRWALLGTLVGGYGSGGLTSAIQAWRIFLDRSTLGKIFIPHNEELRMAAWPKNILLMSYAVLAAMLPSRLVLRWAKPGPLVFLALWAATMLLPTFQIWHIYPNLVGSRLFFLSSAPFSIMISLAALPVVDTLGKRPAQVLTVVGTLTLLALIGAWFALLRVNCKPWIRAGQDMAVLRSQLIAALTTVSPGKRALILDLPQDFSGAGMLTRPQYLQILARPPLAPRDLSHRLITIEPPIAGSHDFMWPGLFRRIIKNPMVQAVYRWDFKSGQLVVWNAPDGSSSYQFVISKTNVPKLRVSPGNTSTTFASRWSLASGNTPQVEVHDTFLRLYPHSCGITVNFPGVSVNPLEGNLIYAHLTLSNQTPTGQRDPVQIVWESRTPGEDLLGVPVHKPIEANAIAQPITDGRYLCWVGRYRKWTLNGNICQLGIHLSPGDYYADLSDISVVSGKSLVPELGMSHTANGALMTAWSEAPFWSYSISPSRMSILQYDASKIPGAHMVRSVVTGVGTTFDPPTEHNLSSIIPFEFTARTYESLHDRLSGQFPLPDIVLQQPGLHQARVIAVDQSGAPVGLPSEPVTFVVRH